MHEIDELFRQFYKSTRQLTSVFVSVESVARSWGIDQNVFRRQGQVRSKLKKNISGRFREMPEMHFCCY